MIVKELGPPADSMDRFQAAGRRAEEQMAFYLKRYFGQSPEIFVLNDVKTMLFGEFAQIDHLVILPEKFVFIESKSVCGSIRVTENMQWIREYQGTERGMKSPRVQLEMQAMILLENINQYTNSDWVPKENTGLIAISDEGVIKYPRGTEIKPLVKADQVPARIMELNQCEFESDEAFSASRKKMLQISSYLIMCSEIARNLRPFAKPGGIKDRNRKLKRLKWDGSEADKDEEYRHMFEFMIDEEGGRSEKDVYLALEKNLCTTVFQNVLDQQFPFA